MQTLLLTQVLPYPPDSGPKVKTWNVIKYLAPRHDITLVSFVRGDQSAEVKVLERYCKAVHTVPMERSILSDGRAMLRSFRTGQPWMILRDDRPEMRRLIDRLGAESVSSLNAFDLVHADQLNMAQYAERIVAQRLPRARKLLDEHNALWLLYQRLAETMSPGPRKWLLERDWRLLKTYEGRICRQFDVVTAVSHEDKRALESAMGRRSEIIVIPIAVDTDEVAEVHRQPAADHILHIGTMFWPPNVDGIVWFIREVFPIIRAYRPQTIFDVVGARPPREISALGGEETGINVTGYVADPSPYYERTGVMVVPLRAGGGMRVKILNALSQAMPIVTTKIGCEGIAVENGKHLLIADTPEDFARAVLRLLTEPRLALQLGQNGRALIQQEYDYRLACQPLDAVYQSPLS